MRQIECDRYQIGTFAFEIRHNGEIPFPRFFGQFQSPDICDIHQVYELSLADRIPQMSGKMIARRNDIEVFGDEGRERRLFRFLGAPMAYGCYEEVDDRHSRCVLNRDFLQFAQVDTVFCSLFAFEKHLLAESGCILHCAALCVEDGVILFSGPSGIGKSTQAALWTEHVPGARVLNGDRALLQRKNGRWHVFGWPVSGSSEICFNEVHPLRAVVFLQQEEQNRGVLCKSAAAVKQLVSQMTVNSWSAWAVTRVWELAEALAADIPVYRYGCNQKPEAVRTLQMLLGREDA